MKRRFLQKLNYKYKLLLILVSVFLIPFVLVSILFFFKFHKEEQDSYARESRELFSQSVYSVNFVFQEIHRVSDQLLLDPSFTSAGKGNTVSGRNEICRKLNTYLLNSSYLSEIALFSSEDNLVYFSGGTSRPRLYLEQIYPFDVLTYEKLLSLEDSLHLEAFSDVSRNTGSSCIQFLLPTRGTHFDLAVFTVDGSVLSEFENTILKNNGDYLELYYNDALLYDSRTEASQSRADYRSLFDLSADETVQANSSGGRLFLFYQSESNLTKFFLSKDSSGGYRLLKSFGVYLLTLSAILLLGLALVCFFWKGAYRPIAEVLSVLPKTATGNELDRVKNTLIAFSREKEQLHQNLDSSLPALRKQLITSVIKGAYPTAGELNRQSRPFGFVCSGAYFFIFTVCLVNMKGKPKNLDSLLEEIAEWCNSYYFEDMSCLGFVDQMNEKIIFIANTSDCGKKLLHERLLSFHNALNETFGFESNMGCSNIYTNTGILSNAYVEALSALDYRVVSGSGKIIYFSQISFSNYSHGWYPDALLKKFSVVLNGRDEEAIHGMIDEIMDDLHKKDVPVYMAKYVCYDIMRLLADAVASEDASPEKVTIGYHNIMNIARVSSFEQITEILHRNITHVLSLHRKSDSSSADSDLRRHFISFIDENYMNYDFSMNSLVQEFHLSESTLRKMFKSAMGITFLEYLTEKRIEKSRELLVTTQLSLKEIAFRTGYTDVSSFIRRFKQKTGMPPGEYRLLAGRNKDDAFHE